MMNWMRVVSPFASLTNRQMTIVVITSLCGIGVFAYMVVVRRRDSDEEAGERVRKKTKDQAATRLRSEIILQLTEAKDSLQKSFKYQQTDQQQDLDDLVVMMDQLEYLLSCVNDMQLFQEASECVMSINKKVTALSNMIDIEKDHMRTRQLKEAEIPGKDEECLLNAAKNERQSLSYHEDYDDDDDISSCSEDSFLSAVESIPDVISIDKSIDYDGETRALLLQYGHLDFYREGIMEYVIDGIHVRTLRTEMLGCENDADFKVKVYCIRQSFNELLKDDGWRNWILEKGHNLLIDIMNVAEKNITEFEKDYGLLVDYCQDERNWTNIEEELRGRGVCCMGFYDIVLDFVIMDSFDDLANPPYVLTSVMQNSWLADSIKSSALSTAVWSLLTAKVRMLQNPNAFMAKLYQLSQHITPVLVWGLLGPSGKLHNACHSFKDIMLGFLQDIFSLSRSNYKTKKTLSDDIISNAKRRLLEKESLKTMT